MDNRQIVSQHNFRIGVFDVEPARNLVSNNDEVQTLEPRIMDVLCVLASEPGEVHTRESLIERIWQVEYGGDESLTRAIGVLRKTFRDAGEDAEYIETITKRGYRLTQPVTVLEASPRSAVPVSDPSGYRRRKGLFAGFTAVVLIIAAFVGYSVLSEGNKQTPTETNASAGVGKTEQISIAVLPFDDFSEGKDQEYFANGIAEELLNVLAGVDGLRVTSRTSSFTFKNDDTNIVEIADVLNVGHILVGSVRKSETTIRISVQLIDAASDQQMWSQTYDRPLSTENLFETQDDIAEAIVSELKGQLSIDENLRGSRQIPLEAYELYLRSRYQMNKRLPDSIRAGIVGFKQVTEMAPEFAPAYSGLVDSYVSMMRYAGNNEAEMIKLMEDSYARAFELAPNSAEVLTSATYIKPSLEERLVYADRAIAVNPNYAFAYHRRGRILMRLGRHEEALVTMQKGRELDPLSNLMMILVFYLQEKMGDRDAALQTAKEHIKLHPDTPFGYTHIALLQIDEADYPGAHATLKDAQALNPEFPKMQRLLALVYTQVGMLDHALAVAKSPGDQAFALIASGNAEAARKISDDTVMGTWPGYTEIGFAYYRLGDFSQAYPRLVALDQEIRMLDRLIDRRDAKSIAIMADVYRREGDPDADFMIAKLAATVEGKDPADFRLPHLFTTSGDLEFLKGNYEAGIKMYAKAADLGLPEAGAQYMRFPGVDEIRDKPEWKIVEKHLQNNAAKYRAEIEAQLANPKPNWKLPKE